MRLESLALAPLAPLFRKFSFLTILIEDRSALEREKSKLNYLNLSTEEVLKLNSLNTLTIEWAIKNH